MKTLLFLCTGNFYRSRFAELYFRHLCAANSLEWQVDSRGLALEPQNVGLSHYTQQECRRLGISIEPLREPIPLSLDDLTKSDLTIAVKETEHRPLMRKRFPDWEHKVVYWEVHDLDVEPASLALPQLRVHVESLFQEVQQGTVNL
jgi:protein-tyrosine phosphatase